MKTKITKNGAVREVAFPSVWLAKGWEIVEVHTRTEKQGVAAPAGNKKTKDDDNSVETDNPEADDGKKGKKAKKEPVEVNPKLEEETLAERDYAKERANYHGKPEQMAKNRARKRARYAMEKLGKVKKGDKMDVHHKDNNPENNDPKNLAVQTQAVNRAEPRHREADAGAGGLGEGKSAAELKFLGRSPGDEQWNVTFKYQAGRGGTQTSTQSFVGIPGGSSEKEVKALWKKRNKNKPPISAVKVKTFGEGKEFLKGKAKADHLKNILAKVKKNQSKKGAKITDRTPKGYGPTDEATQKLRMGDFKTEREAAAPKFKIAGGVKWTMDESSEYSMDMMGTRGSRGKHTVTARTEKEAAYKVRRKEGLGKQDVHSLKTTETEMEEETLSVLDQMRGEILGEAKKTFRVFYRKKQGGTGKITVKNVPDKEAAIMMASRKAKNWADISHAEELTEARSNSARAQRDARRHMGQTGMLSKKDVADVDDDSEADDGEGKVVNIIMQLRKVVSLRGQKPVTFKDGKKEKVNPTLARQAMAKFDSLQGADRKEKFMAKAWASHKGLKAAVQENDMSAEEMELFFEAEAKVPQKKMDDKGNMAMQAAVPMTSDEYAVWTTDSSAGHTHDFHHFDPMTTRAHGHTHEIVWKGYGKDKTVKVLFGGEKSHDHTPKPLTKMDEESLDERQGKSFFQGLNDRKNKGIKSKSVDKDKFFNTDTELVANPKTQEVKRVKSKEVKAFLKKGWVLAEDIDMTEDENSGDTEKCSCGNETGKCKCPADCKCGCNTKVETQESAEPEGSLVLEKKSDYVVYHNSYSSAVQHAVAKAAERGFEVDEDDYHTKVAVGPRKPSEGNTNSFSIAVTKNGKKVKNKALQMQVFGMGGGKYELNMYIESYEPNKFRSLEGNIRDIMQSKKL